MAVVDHAERHITAPWEAFGATCERHSESLASSCLAILRQEQHLKFPMIARDIRNVRDLPETRLYTFHSQDHPVRLASASLPRSIGSVPAVFFLPGAAGLMPDDSRADLFSRSLCAAG